MKMILTRAAAALLTLCLLLSLCACGAKNKKNDTAEETVLAAEPTPGSNAMPQVSEEIETPLGSAEITAGVQEDGVVKAQAELAGASGEAAVEDGNMTVSVTVPAALAGDEILQDSLISVLGESGADGVHNEDGSITYTMTFEQYDRMLPAVDMAIESQLLLLSGNSLMGISEITHNDDFTEFNVTLTDESMGLMTTAASVSLYAAGRVYNLFAGSADADITVKYFSADGTMLQMGHSSESD